MEKRSITLSGHRTSILLEPEFWQGLRDAAAEQRVSLAQLIATIDQARDPTSRQGQNLASALRVYVLQRATKP